MKSKHIAMWTCPRSRSTVVARAFEQLDGCVLFDEPLTGAYLVATGKYKEQEQQEALKYCETNYNKVIRKLTGKLPDWASFSFQKQMAMHALPEFGKDWLKSLNNFFLIRDPKEIILSLQKIHGNKKQITMEDIGYESLFYLFKDIEYLTKDKPLVVDSSDLVQNPKITLKFLCDEIGVQFSDKMLTWKSNSKKTKLLWTEDTSYYIWYSRVLDSTEFINSESQDKVDFPNELLPLVEKCMPFYEQLYNYRVVL